MKETKTCGKSMGLADFDVIFQSKVYPTNFMPFFFDNFAEFWIWAPSPPAATRLASFCLLSYYPNWNRLEWLGQDGGKVSYGVK